MKSGFALPNIPEFIQAHPIETGLISIAVLAVIYLKFFRRKKVVTPTGYSLKTPIRV